MKDPVIQVQARLGSTRLPGKVLFHLGDRRVVEWVVSRCSEVSSSTVLAIGDRRENAALVEWCERTGVEYVIGPEDDLLARHLQVAEAFEGDPVVRVTGDCPFVPAGEIDRLLTEYREADLEYVTNVTDDMPIGVGVDVISRRTLDELSEAGETHPVKRLRETPDDWNMKFSPASPWSSYGDAHVAVDTPSDYWTLMDAIEAVGTDPKAVVRWVAEEDI